MAIKPFHNVKGIRRLESKIKDSRQNLLEFTLKNANHTDFSTFDILSVTRADLSPGYQCRKIHRKIHTQAARVAAQSALIIPLPKRK